MSESKTFICLIKVAFIAKLSDAFHALKLITTKSQEVEFFIESS